MLLLSMEPHQQEKKRLTILFAFLHQDECRSPATTVILRWTTATPTVAMGRRPTNRRNLLTRSNSRIEKRWRCFDFGC